MTVKKIYYVGIVIALFIGLMLPVFGKENVAVDKGNVGTSYTVNFGEPKAMLSRDGSPAVPIKSGTKITKPGVYFLSLFDSKGTIKIQRFKIISAKTPKVWVINTRQDLDESLKIAIENYHQEIIIKFNYGDFEVNALNEFLSDSVDQLLNKYPKLTFETYTLTTAGGEKPSLKLKITYPDHVVATLKKYDDEVDKKIVPLINELIQPNMSDVQREIAIYRYLAQNITYGQVYIKVNEKNYPSNKVHTMQGALIDEIAVCDGYAKAFMYLTNAVGTETIKVIGTGRGVPHAWNMVKLNDQYYHVDVTFGDTDENQIGEFYDYLNETDAYMDETHDWIKKDYPICNSYKMSFMYLPYTFNHVYKVDSLATWYTIAMKIKAENVKEASVIFYRDNVNKWKEAQLTNQLSLILQKGIRYTTIDKYDGKIINFKIE